MLRPLGFALLLLMLPILVLPGCLSGSISRHQKFLDAQVVENPDIEEHMLEEEGFSLHYRSIGQAERAVLIWIHGTPGGWSDIGRLMVDEDFTTQIRILSIDRPGWGQSSFEGRRGPIPDFTDQVRLIQPLLSAVSRADPGVPVILAGHSWGAPLAVSLAAATDAHVAGVLALAGPFDPDLAGPRWYNRAARIPPISVILSNALRKANVEMYALRDNLRRSLPAWQQLEVPLIVVQGATDQLVPYGHFLFAQEIFPAATTRFVELAAQGHLMQIQRTAMIADCVRALADRRPADCRDNH